MASVTKSLGLTGGYRFQPDDDELIEFFLVPRLRGQRLPLEGVIIDEDPLSAPPWVLFKRNDLDAENVAYFFAPGDKANSRKVRACAGGRGTWVGQKPEKGGKLRVGDEILAWQKYRLNFHDGVGRSGSTGWVMLEYSVAVPDGDCAAFKVCQISFSGHGLKRKRVPDGDDDSVVATHDQLQVAATPSSTATAMTSYQDPNPTGAHAWHQDQEHFMMQHQGYSEDAGPWIDQHQDPFATATQQQFVDQELVNLGSFDMAAMDQGMMPLMQMDQETCVPQQFAEYGGMAPIDQDFYMPEQYVDYGYATMPPPMQQEYGVPPEQFFNDDAMLGQQLLQSSGDFATTGQAGEGFGDHWASAGQDYDHHHHVFPQ